MVLDIVLLALPVIVSYVVGEELRTQKATRATIVLVGSAHLQNLPTMPTIVLPYLATPVYIVLPVVD